MLLVRHRRSRGELLGVRPGETTALSDAELTRMIRGVIAECPFAGEGHRKVRARLRRDHGIHLGKNRVLRLMRSAGLPASQRAARRRRPRVHDGTIVRFAALQPV